jgi:hypothetical protein
MQSSTVSVPALATKTPSRIDHRTKPQTIYEVRTAPALAAAMHHGAITRHIVVITMQLYLFTSNFRMKVTSNFRMKGKIYLATIRLKECNSRSPPLG